MTGPHSSAPIEPGLSGPLVITPVVIPGAGTLGLTHCPGRHHVDGAGRRWRRDLTEDLTAIQEWNAGAVITLIEHHELGALGVADLPGQLAARHLPWFHLPIPDMQPPGEAFRRGWASDGEEVLHRLAAGDRLIVHCAAGLGRTGMLAAKLLATFSMAPAQAIALVREHRPGAIETETQVRYVETPPHLGDTSQSIAGRR